MDDAIAQTVLKIIQQNKDGALNDDLVKYLPDVTAEARLGALNKLLKEGAIEVLQRGDKLIYRERKAENMTVLRESDREESVVYRIIEDASNKGIWIRDIRMRSNLNMTQLNKILKNLETKKLIKAVKSVNASKKKVYMLYNLEPDRSVSGGAWYQENDFESEFVDVLSQQSFRFLQMKRDAAKKLHSEGPLQANKLAYCSVQEVHKFISDLGISKVKLDEDDLETILKTLMYSGSAERIRMVDGAYVYAAVPPLLKPTGLVETPCGICPIIKSCSKWGDVTPKKCVYMAEWLNS